VRLDTDSAAPYDGSGVRVEDASGYWVCSSNSNALQVDVELGGGFAFLIDGNKYTLTVLGVSTYDRKANISVRRKVY
jgi:hypothetical protein